MDSRELVGGIFTKTTWARRNEGHPSVLNVGEKARVGLVLVKKGGGFTPNLRHLWAKLLWFRRVWEDEMGECSGRRCPHLRRHRWGPLAAEAWPRAPAQLGLSQGMFWRKGGRERRSGVGVGVGGGWGLLTAPYAVVALQRPPPALKSPG